MLLPGEIYTVPAVKHHEAEREETHQLLKLPLPVAELLIHAEADLSAFQCGDDLQLRVVVLDDVVLQHETQDLGQGSRTQENAFMCPTFGRFLRRREK